MKKLLIILLIIAGCERDITESLTVHGCTDVSACNFNVDAFIWDDSCEYPEENFDCDGNCAVAEDCEGVCGGSALEDECGICDSDSSNDNTTCD